MNLRLRKKTVTKVILRPPECKENEIYLKDLTIEREQPCGILTINDKKIAIFRQHGTLMIQDLSDLKILSQDPTMSMQGAIQSIGDDFGIKDVYLFKDTAELKNWSK